MKLTQTEGSPITTIDCHYSNSISKAFYSVSEAFAGEIQINVTYATGREYAYYVPADKFYPYLGMESVGRFVNLVVKANATWVKEYAY